MTITSGVSLTAVVAASARAIDSHRPDALIADPYAEALVAAADLPQPLTTRPAPQATDSDWRSLSDLVGTRARFFDDQLLGTAGASVRQIVILAAGLDTRAYRLPVPASTVLFEIDQPAVLDFKRRALADLDAVSGCEHRLVPHDLRGDWPAALREQGFRPDEPTGWLAEGLLYYLTAPELDTLLGAVDALSAPGSRWASDHDPGGSRPTLDDREVLDNAAATGLDLTALLESGVKPDPGQWLRDRGWVVETRTLRTAAVEYGRTLDPLATRIYGPFAFTEARKV